MVRATLTFLATLLLPLAWLAAEPSRSTRPARPAVAGDRVIKLAFTGDVALNWRGTAPELKVFPANRNPLRFLAPVFKAADLAVSNMEGVLMRRDPKYAEKRLNLWAPRASGQIFKPAGINVVSTANNHIFDGRDKGVLETLEVLRATGVNVFGSGRSSEEARRPYIFRRHGACIALVPATTKVNKGVRGRATVAWYPWREWDQLPSYIKRVKASCPFVIVYIHWGQEKAHFPKRKIKEFAHRMVDAGADLVVGHHPHVLQGVEYYRGGAIAYSLGNLVFSNPMIPTRRTGVLWVELKPGTPTRLTRLELVPVFIWR
ncbi:MAG: CapA family protein, partial [bacterium]